MTRYAEIIETKRRHFPLRFSGTKTTSAFGIMLFKQKVPLTPFMINLNDSFKDREKAGDDKPQNSKPTSSSVHLVYNIQVIQAVGQFLESDIFSLVTLFLRRQFPRRTNYVTLFKHCLSQGVYIRTIW